MRTIHVYGAIASVIAATAAIHCSPVSPSTAKGGGGFSGVIPFGGPPNVEIEVLHEVSVEPAGTFSIGLASLAAGVSITNTVVDRFKTTDEIQLPSHEQYHLDQVVVRIKVSDLTVEEISNRGLNPLYFSVLEKDSGSVLKLSTRFQTHAAEIKPYLVDITIEIKPEASTARLNQKKRS